MSNSMSLLHQSPHHAGGPRARQASAQDERTARSPLRAASFGCFRLFPAQRLLLDADKAVALGSRALDILIALVEQPGELIGKHELIARVLANKIRSSGQSDRAYRRLAACAWRWP